MNSSTWTVPQMWKGGDAWILGGGSSLPYQFDIPSKVIQAVESGISPMSVYSKYLKILHNKHIISVNVSFKLGDWIDVLFFCDREFWRREWEAVIKFKGLKVSDVSNLNVVRTEKYHSLVKRLKRNYSANGLSTKPDEINWNFNSGAAAINFALHTGVKRVFLLGFDCVPNKDGRTHFHQNEKRYEKPVTQESMNRFIKRFPEIKKDAEKIGLEIYNVNLNSGIDIFPKITLKEALKIISK